jgi:hypothetical protein
MIVENLSGSDLIELFGYDDPELMGFSLKKIGRGLKKGASTVGRVASKSVVGKAVSYTVKKPGRALAIAAAPATGGLSLLATKKGRDVVGTSARFTQKKILRPVGGVVATAARVPAVQQAARTAMSALTAGKSELAIQAARKFLPSKPKAPATPEPILDAAQVSPSGVSMPMVLGIGGGVAALALLAFAMKGKK